MGLCAVRDSIQGWPVAFTGGICHRYLPVNTAFPKNSPKYLLMKELDSYCGTIDNTIYAYVKNYHTCSDIFS